MSPSSAGVSRTAPRRGRTPRAQAELRKLVRARGEPLDIGLVELDDLGDQQDLPRDAGLLQRRLHALVDDALMRGVLVDDHDAVARLRHDVGLVQLRARRAERAVDQVWRGFGRDPRVGRRRAGVERRLRGFGEARQRGRALRQRTRRRVAPVPAAPRRRCSGRNAAMVASPPVVAVRCASRASASCKARTIRRTHQPGVAEAHLGLGRMHVHVDLARRDRDEQRDDRIAVARQIVRVGAAHRAEQQLVAHRAAVDEEVLRERVALACRSAAPRSPRRRGLRVRRAPRPHWRGIRRQAHRRAAQAARQAPAAPRPRSPARAPRPRA